MKQLRLLCVLYTAALTLCYLESPAQKDKTKKYPSLFWEISGNGLKKPSYLFGTMHVSSKMVFHLSDSFYYAIKNADAVALELNPEAWQGDMFKMQQAQLNLSKFSTPELADFINEKSFQLTRYEDNIKRALSEEPTVVNSLLYRSSQPRADFEENTYLDLYIYQTGRKLGKMAAGVEDYRETERLIMEAYQDRAKEKKRKPLNTDGVPMYEIERRMQEAYRKGDLDLMDSLDNLTVTSPAFTEKFLYKRNEIQANSIDTILQKRSLFVGVGAAHLPGERGVIELLRKKGYKLRPIMMPARDARQKDDVDKLRVPVNFASYTTDDGLIKLKLPGNFYKRVDARLNDSWQYADMNNGSYYMLTRVANHAGMIGDKQKDVLKKVDSLLYENIPGKILKKTSIIKNGFSGYDITNRTRRGDIQRYNIFVTPFEVLVFKMSGTDNYVEGKEAETFFSSIELLKPKATGQWVSYEPSQGGFAVSLPHEPYILLNRKNTDRTDRWEYEALDSKNGDAYMIWKKSVYNFNFLEEDTFDLTLIDESFKQSELIDRQIYKNFGQKNAVPFVDLKYALKNGQYIKARAYIKGPDYYLLAARSSNEANDFTTFFNSFRFTDYKYSSTKHFKDTLLNIDVETAALPDIDTSLRLIMDNILVLEYNGTQDTYNSRPLVKNALFKSDSTGEVIALNVQTFPKYYYSRDSAKFWRDKLDEKKIGKDMVMQTKQFFTLNDSVAGYKLAFTDTNSSRKINACFLLKDNRLFKFLTLTDTANKESAFVRNFFTSFRPLNNKPGQSVFNEKISAFFEDFHSTDSSLKKRANSAIASVYFGKNGIEKIVNAINNLRYTDKNYFELKSRFITELGYIDDSCCVSSVIQALKELYKKTADTSYFQNPVFNALARLQTKESFQLVKQMLLQDPPVFEETYEYSRLFKHFEDTLPLAKNLFPDILQLSQLQDYQEEVNGLLRSLVDSGYMHAPDYQSYFNKIYFDAKVELKKQQSKDEKDLQNALKDDEDERFVPQMYNRASKSLLDDCAVLLMPFYDKKPVVPSFFDKLLQSRDQQVKLDALILMVRNNKKVADSVFEALARDDQYRAQLLNRLEKIKRTDLFPETYKKQEDVAKALLLNDKSYEKFAQVQLIKKEYMELKDKKGYVYFFKYKIKKDDDWQMGISGLQPLNIAEVSSNEDLVKMTEKRLRENESVDEQFKKQLQRLIFEMHKSGKQFYTSTNYRSLLFGFNED